MQVPDCVAVSEEGGVRTIELSRPAKSNALDEEMVESLLSAVSSAIADRVHIIAFKGAGRNFCAGFDTAHLAGQSDGDLLRRFVRLEMLLQMIRRSPCTTIACATGAAFGAGADLVAASAFRVGTANLRMRFPGFRFGVALGTRHLTQIVGPDIARSLLLSNREIDSTMALSHGLVQQIVEENDFSVAIAAHERNVADLHPAAVQRILRLTDLDTDDADLASLVRSVADPGLRERIEAYRDAQRSVKGIASTSSPR